ncbi:hypothetical protein [Variovorax sp. KK3]|uniref:hypothetical protein n=1 Tax=Variovorax sp. KK3 TaxID=1855728 RepID=UPI00097BDAB3|nr:hypothetical protein [Variovorax sp. KK3]
MTHFHLRTGISDSDWIQRSLDESESDPVGMWQMVKTGRDGFGLSGPALEDFVRRFISEMVAGGAHPIVGDRSAPFGWRRTIDHGDKPVDIAASLINSWKRSGIDPDVDGVWFARPSVWK